jgi:hypothetical protein
VYATGCYERTQASGEEMKTLGEIAFAAIENGWQDWADVPALQKQE